MHIEYICSYTYIHNAFLCTFQTFMQYFIDTTYLVTVVVIHMHEFVIVHLNCLNIQPCTLYVSFNSILFWNLSAPAHMMNLNHALWVLKERKLIPMVRRRKIEKEDILNFNSHAQLTVHT